MKRPLIIAGTDTGIGKTVFAAGLTSALGAHYWKPVQSGLDDGTDSDTVARLGSIPADRILPEAYRLKLPASPHLSARAEGVEIKSELIQLPSVSGPVVVELAGGLLVPLTPDLLTIDQVGLWIKQTSKACVILCARTSLGTINHSLLSIEALRRRAIPLLGIAFIGEPEPDVEETIVGLGRVRRLGRLPTISPLTAESLQAGFRAAFNRTDFEI